MSLQSRVGWMMAVAALLAACGGGGSSGDVPTPATSPTPIPAPATASIQLQGTAAIGLAIENVQIKLQCQTESFSTATDAAGRFSVLLPAQAFPCLLQTRDLTKNTLLHSFAMLPEAPEVSARANITPFTDLILTRMLGAEGGSLFNQGSALAWAGKISASRAAAAQQDIASALAPIVDLSGLRNLVTTELSAASLGNPDTGDAHDLLLDRFAASLSATQWATLRAETARAAAMPVIIIRSPSGSMHASSSFVLSQPQSFPGYADTDPSNLRSEPAIAFWPLVAQLTQTHILTYRPFDSEDLPDGIWPIHFQSWEWTNSIGARSGYRNDNACSLSKIGNTLIASVNGRTWSAAINGANDFQLSSNGDLMSSDGYATSLGVGTFGGARAARHLSFAAKDHLELVHPTYGAFDGGTNIQFWITYDPADANSGASATLLVTEHIQNPDAQTRQAYPYISPQHRCIDRSYTSTGSDGTIPGSSTAP